MNGLCARHLRSKQNRGTIEIALPCRSGADTHGGIRVFHVGGISIGLRIDGDRPQSKRSAGPLNPKGNFAAIGYENCVEHWRSDDPQEGLASYDFVAGRDEHSLDHAIPFSRNRIEHFHSFNSTDSGASRDCLAHGHEGRRIGRRAQIDNP
jgi:hypothetical protein